MEIFVELLVLLVATRALGEVAVRLGLPDGVGELIAGIALAAIVAQFGAEIPFLRELAASPALEFVADFGIFFLVLLAGIEMKPKGIAESSRTSLWVAAGGVVVPLAAGFGLAWLFIADSGLKQPQALLVGVAVSISAIPATVKVLMAVVTTLGAPLLLCRMLPADTSTPEARDDGPDEHGSV